MPSTKPAESIQETVSAILSAPAPVLVVDTCGILDVVRCLYRIKAPNRLFESAIKAMSAAGTSPPNLHILLFEEMETELLRNIESERDNLRKEMQKLKAIGDSALTEQEVESWQHSVRKIGNTLAAYPDRWTSASHRVSTDASCLVRAKARLAAGIKPGKRGSSNLGDCAITEHLLEIVSLLRNEGFAEDVLFVSSNIGDYGELVLKAPLDVEFSRLLIDFHLDLEAAIHQVNL